jgi:hypothetical protein
VVIIIDIAVVVAVVLIALLVRRESQRRHLREKFGPEYERAVQENESPRDADRELASREKRIAGLDIKPLSPEVREQYTQQWAMIQAQFVDRPAPAVAEADRVLVALMAERGYPTEGYEQQLSDLSVHHSRTLEHYRAAHETMQGHEQSEKSTEDLRDAMVRYRTVFEDLLNEGSDNGHEKHDKHDKAVRDEDARDEHLSDEKLSDENHQDRKARTDASNGTN